MGSWVTVQQWTWAIPTLWEIRARLATLSTTVRSNSTRPSRWNACHTLSSCAEMAPQTIPSTRLAVKKWSVMKQKRIICSTRYSVTTMVRSFLKAIWLSSVKTWTNVSWTTPRTSARASSHPAHFLTRSNSWSNRNWTSYETRCAHNSRLSIPTERALSRLRSRRARLLVPRRLADALTLRSLLCVPSLII